MQPPSIASISPIIEETAPFSLKGLKETLLRPINYYEKFANSNGTAIESLESSLRSLSYILPGRFKDSEFVSEICNNQSQEHYNDLLFSNLDRTMSLNQRNLLAYFNYLKSRHPIMKSLMTLINLIRIVQIPLEMIVAKVAKNKKAIFVLVLELSKFIIKFGIWQGSGWRPVPKQFYTSIERRDENNFNVVGEESRVKRLEEKMDRLDLQLKQAKSSEPLMYYLKGHKSNIYTHQPQSSFKPCADWTSWTRELTHLARPCIYALCILIISKGDAVNNKKNWIPLLVSLSMDIYSKWPELRNQTDTDSSQSPLESEERARRLLDFLYYPLRSPLYQSMSSDLLDGIEGKIGQISFLAPVVETIKIYRKLWENVYFYTSAS